MIDDKKLQQDILDELDWDPSVHAAHIGVAVYNGVATLTGHVGSYLEKQHAEVAASRVKGVKAIAEERGVRMPSFFGYMAWSAGILIPLFLVMTFIWFR